MRIENFVLADNTLRRVVGIMFKDKNFIPLIFIFPKESILLPTIHSFFCPPFDAVYLDKNKKVVDFYENVPPFKLSISPKFPSKYLIEAPVGFISKNKIKKGVLIEF